MRPRWNQRRQTLLLCGLFEASLGGIACLLGWWQNEPVLARCWWNVRDAIWGAAASLPLVVVFLLLRHGRFAALREIRRLLDEILPALFGTSSLLEIGIISALAGFGEEFLFRGFLQPWLGRWLGLAGSIAATSLLFGLVHPITRWYVLIATLFGVYLGTLSLLNDNLLLVITAHGLYDWIVLAYLLRSRITNDEVRITNE